MDMFTLDGDIARWETALLSLQGADRLPVLLDLSWHLRQRDTARAVELASEAEILLPESPLSPFQARSAHTRLNLIRAESLWLSGELEQAMAHAEEQRDAFSDLPDPTGCADAHWLLAWICVDMGDHVRSDQEFANAAACARTANDSLRADLADAAIARWAVLRDRQRAVQIWGSRFNAETPVTHPSVATWVNDYLALAASGASDYGAAAAYFIRCYESALTTGQIRAAITAATNIGEDFAILNDHHSALEWMQCALELARPTGWPRSVGACLMHTADTMRRLGQLDAAQEMLREAIDILAPLANARSFAIALQYLGDLSLDLGDYHGALNAFRRLEERADALNQSDFRVVARRGQAHALSHLDRASEALDMAMRAADLANQHGHAFQQAAALRVAAMIHSRHVLPPPEGMTTPNAALHYLHAAFDVASAIDGYTIPGDLLDAMAREYASAGNFERAYEIALSASAAREKTHSQEATNRAIAMQVHHQTEHARNEGQHHRELAESEARRAEAMQRTSATLQHLSTIGQEITAQLDAGAVFQALSRHIHDLTNATTFSIYLTDPQHTMLVRAFGVELGELLPEHTVPLSNTAANSVRALLERREVYIDNLQDADYQVVVPGTVTNMSALFAPLTVGEHAFGVMTVQAQLPHAFGEQERLIFRSLCAFGAIALDNAQAYRQLKDTQAQLVSQEKLAALGSLMAGIAHELNTPIGNSLLIASTLQEKTGEIETQLNSSGLRKSELAAFIDDARKASTLVMRGLTNAADLVNSFKQVAVDRTTEQRRNFNLQQVCHEIIATMNNRVRNAGHTIEMEMSDSIALDSYPGPFGQVIANFINNALLHAFEKGGSGHMLLTATQQGDNRVLVQFRDNGVGIPAQHLNRIFDPFFTTKLGQGGSGLGLSISYNIVTSLLGGQISVTSGPHDGTCFSLDIPLTAPVHDQVIPSVMY